MLFRPLLFALGLVLLVPPLATAQTDKSNEAFAYLARNWNRHGLTQADVQSLVVSDQVTSARSGVTHVYLHQAVVGIPVVTGQMTINIARDGRVIHAAGRLEAGLTLRVKRGTDAIGPQQAVVAFARDAGLEATNLAVRKAAATPGERVELTDGGISRLPIHARLVYADDGTGAIRLAWETTLYLRGTAHDWFGRIDAATGRVLLREDLLVHDTFGPAPDPAPASLAPLADPAPSSMAPLAALISGGASYKVFPYPFESPQHMPTPPPADGRVTVAGIENTTASPFGWHDTNGVAGAEFTVTRGNNTHSYLDRNDDELPDAGADVDGGAALAFDFPVDFALASNQNVGASVTNLFYWNNLIHDILYGYGFDSAAGNFQANTYGQGGTGNDAVDSESQSGADICNETNPCVNNANFSTPGDGQKPRMQMYVGNNVSPQRDGAFDAAVVVHEYGHGVTNRLVGGRNTVNCLSTSSTEEQAGEGWSDWLALMMTMKASDVGTQGRGMATYLFAQPVTGAGIRPARYSTDFAINNYTYQRTRSGLAVPHGVGFVWATTLWDITWDLIGEFGFDPDIANANGTSGNQIAMQLVIEGLKMTACRPGFVDNRDAILAADEALFNGAHTEFLWEAFARRGLGIGASQGSSATNADNTESFVVPEAIAPDAITDLTVVPNGDFVTLAFTATGDDGAVGTAATYSVRFAATPILTEADFDAATAISVVDVPQIAGTPETVVVEGLVFETAYHFAIEATDDSFNPSPLSNSATGTTLSAPAVTIPLDGITATTSTTAMAALTISNAGPSDLRFNVGLTETTIRPSASPAPSSPAANRGEPAKGAPEETGTAQRRDGGGPDAFGYRWADSNEPGGPTYSWIDISATGTSLPLGDDASQSVALPFAFPFYGQDQSTVRIVSNGFLSFGGSSNAYSNAPVPTGGAPDGILAAYWDDLNPTAGGSIRYQDLGDGRFVVSWIDIKHWTSGGGRGSFTFQAILNQNGSVVYQYKTMAPDPADAVSATIGIENYEGTDGLQTVFNAPYIENELAIRYSALWVETDVTSGRVPSGASQEVTLTFDANGLAPGTYMADLTVVTNDPLNASVVIPIRLTVGTVANEPDQFLDFAGTHLLSEAYPNPATVSARLDLTAAEAQNVRVDLYDALGRRVTTLFEGSVAARSRTAIALETSSLATGTYVIRISGESFADTRRLTVSR